MRRQRGPSAEEMAALKSVQLELVAKLRAGNPYLAQAGHRVDGRKAGNDFEPIFIQSTAEYSAAERELCAIEPKTPAQRRRALQLRDATRRFDETIVAVVAAPSGVRAGKHKVLAFALLQSNEVLPLIAKGAALRVDGVNNLID